MTPSDRVRKALEHGGQGATQRSGAPIGLPPLRVRSRPRRPNPPAWPAGHESDGTALGGVRTDGSANEQGPGSGSATPAANYKVGYRRPPPNGQFKKGQSGNP